MRNATFFFNSLVFLAFVVWLVNATHKGKYTTHFFYKQPHFRVEPRVAMKIPKMRLKVAMKYFFNIFGIEAQGC